MNQLQRVLITGASGFIGGHALRHFAQRGCRVFALVRPASRVNDPPDGVEIVRGDLTEIASLREVLRRSTPDLVIHLGGVVNALDPLGFQPVNTQGSWNIAAACAESPEPPRLLAVSSLAAAGPSPAARSRCEGEPCTPVSHYGWSKLAGEWAVRAWAGRAPITIVRPPIVFGPGDASLDQVVDGVRRTGLFFALGDATLRYSMIHVDDLLEGILLVAERGETLPISPEGAEAGQGVYHLTHPRPVLAQEFAAWIGEGLGRRVRVVRLSAPLWPRLAGRAGDLAGRLLRRPLLLNSDKMAEARAGSWTCAGDKALAHLGFQPVAPLGRQMVRVVAEWRG